MTNSTDKNSNAIRAVAPSKSEQTSTGTNKKGQSPSPIPTVDDSPVIFTYSRKEALADGFQIDVSRMATEAGFKVPVFMTLGVFDNHVRVPEGVTGQDEAGRLWDVLFVLRQTIKATQTEERFVDFRVLVRNSDNANPELVHLIAEIGAMDFDNPSPAITIAFPYED